MEVALMQVLTSSNRAGKGGSVHALDYFNDECNRPNNTVGVFPL
jgi:hypothetical protein